MMDIQEQTEFHALVSEYSQRKKERTIRPNIYLFFFFLNLSSEMLYNFS
jgi:hypothetical protein